MSDPRTALTELRRQYEKIVAQSTYQIAEAKAQLDHIDALLVDGLLQKEERPEVAVEMSPLELSTLVSAVETAFVPSELSAVTPPAPTPAPTAKARAKTTPQAESLQADRTPRQLQPAYEGLTRFDAIAQALQTTAGQEMKIDTLAEKLFGELSAAERKIERKRLNTLLYNGEKKGLWQKGQSPSSYLMTKSKAAEMQHAAAEVAKPEAPTASASIPETTVATSTSSRGSLSLLPEFAGMNKLEALSKVLNDQAGHVLHQDSIIQLLYGDLSPEVIKKETRKLRASLFQGVNKGLWQRAPKQPSSYLMKASKSRKAKDTIESSSSAPAKAEAEVTTEAPSTKKPGRPSGSSNKSKPVQAAPKATSAKASRGREQVLLLPDEFEGLSKIEAVEKVLGEHPGTVVSIPDIIERLYGKLSGAELKAEKDRIKDVMTRGIKRGLWSRAEGVASSYVVQG